MRKPIRKEDVKEPSRMRMFYKLRDHQVYVSIPLKSGCTYFKNLFYYLDHGELHEYGDFIHDDEARLTRGVTEDFDRLDETPHVYMIVRHPVARFFSLYFDKIANPYNGSFSWFQDQVGKDIGIVIDKDMTKDEHQENALKFVLWLEENFAGKTPGQGINPHWQRQSHRYDHIKSFQPVLLPLEGVNEVFPKLVEPEVPSIAEAMDIVRSRNVSHKPYSTDELRHWPLVKRIRAIYEEDFRLHKMATRNHKRLIREEEKDIGEG